MKKLFLLCLITIASSAMAGLWEPALLNPSFESVENGGAAGGWGYVIDDWYESETPTDMANFYENGPSIGLEGDGDLWAGTETGGLYYQAVGTYSPNETYIITLLIGARNGTSFNTGSISIYAGGDEEDAADAVDLKTIEGVVLIDSIEITTDDGTSVGTDVYEVTVELSTGSAGTLGELLWLEFGSVTGKDYFDNLQILTKCSNAATLLAPVNGETASNTPTFEWEEPCAITATSYDLEYRTDPNFANSGTETIADVTSPHSSVTLPYDTTYYWRIISTDGSTTSYSDVSEFITKKLDSPPVVDAGDNILTGLELVSPPNSLALNGSVTDDGTSSLEIDGWVAYEAMGGGLTANVTFADDKAPETTATISEAGTYILSLSATDATGTVTGQIEVIVHANACDAAKATGEWTANYFDRNDDCIVDIEDFAVFAAEWLNSTALTEGWEYEGDFGDPSNSLIAEYWTDIDGGDPNDLLEDENYPDNPAGAYFVTDELRGLYSGNTYGQRIVGYIVAPATGEYTFYISSDDGSRLFLSSDTNPVDTDPVLGNQIAEVIGWTNPDDWVAEEGQTSAPVSLTAGQYYYVEVLHKEGGGGDHVSVGWKLPGEETINVIPASAMRHSL